MCPEFSYVFWYVRVVVQVVVWCVQSSVVCFGTLCAMVQFIVWFVQWSVVCLGVLVCVCGCAVRPVEHGVIRCALQSYPCDSLGGLFRGSVLCCVCRVVCDLVCCALHRVVCCIFCREVSCLVLCGVRCAVGCDGLDGSLSGCVLCCVLCTWARCVLV